MYEKHFEPDFTFRMKQENDYSIHDGFNYIRANLLMPKQFEFKGIDNFFNFVIQAAAATPDRIDQVQKIIVRNSLENRGKDRRTRIIVVIKTSYTVVFHLLMKINDFTEFVYNSVKRIRTGDSQV